MKIVVGDIGGTHARFALAELRSGAAPAIGPMHKYRTREHQGLASAWAAVGRDCGERLPRQAAFGVAAPIEGEVLRFVNSGWEIDRAAAPAVLGLDRLLLLNDFGAVANAVSVLGAESLRRLGGPDSELPTDAPVTVMGPGTGLGVSVLLRRKGRVEVIETEAAHIAFAPQTEAEEALERAIRARHGRCSVERLVSGPGLVAIYAALGGGAWDVLDAGTLWAAAVDGSDALASRALDLLVGIFGAVAGDIALAHGSMGVAITGGLANRMAERLASAAFHDRFVDKGRYRGRMERVAVHLSTYPEPGLLGAAVAFQRTSAS